MKPTDFAYNLSKYFKNYLPGVLGLSSNTISSYRDTFSIFLKYCKLEKGISLEKLKISTLSIEFVMDFLQHLENMGNSISTRNQRLTALRAFFRYLQLVEPSHMFLTQQLLAIRQKRQKKPLIDYLTIEGMTLIIHEPASETKTGYRDMLILALLYDSGARVSELTNIKIGDIRLENPAIISLSGKGGKHRIVPISAKTSDLIRNYITKENLLSVEHNVKLLFTNRSGTRLTRAGVSYIISKYANLARQKNPLLIPKTLTPHCFRHSKAMHLLQSGVDLVYIRDFLGHESIKTTEIYAKTDSSAKRSAIEGAYVNVFNDDNFKKNSWNEDSELMEWLRNI